jgi:hypothetical protein
MELDAQLTSELVRQHGACLIVTERCHDAGLAEVKALRIDHQGLMARAFVVALASGGFVDMSQLIARRLNRMPGDQRDATRRNHMERETAKS